jgi:hypothetical protein
MRPILLLAAILLASCDAPSDRNQAAAPPLQPGSSSGDAAPGPAPPPATKPAPAPVRADAIPAAFHGVYDESREACARPSQYRMTIGAREIDYHESIGTVRAVTIAGPADAVVEADYQGEGESWRSSRRLALDGDRLTISGDGTEAVRVRCP